MQLDDITLLLSLLKKQKLNYICHTCEIVDIGFGENILGLDHRGRESTKPRYAIHIQCPFDFRCDDQILFCYDDLLSPIDNYSGGNIFDGKNSLFDKKIIKHKEFLSNQVVEDVLINEYGEIKIILTSSVINVYNASTSDDEDEFWRFIEFKNVNPFLDKGKHFVRRKNGFSTL